MYLDHFSLKRHPFRITPDPSLFFHGGAHGRGVVLDALVYGITTGEGILKVVGEVGSGKTMLCRMLEERLPDTVEIVYLANPNLSARDIVYAIAFELKLPVEANTDRLVVMQKLQEYLLGRHAAGASVVVFIEEAQGMPLETLEEIRLLSNLETHRHKLMQIVLFGQPELDRKLEDRSIRQLRERITHSFYLQPLSEQEIREYLHFRLQAAGCPWPQLFSPEAESLLAKASEGLSRRINILADKSLLAAYADPGSRPDRRNSAGEILPMVMPKHVKTAINDTGYPSERPKWFIPLLATGVVALLLVSGAGIGYWLNKGTPQGPATTSPIGTIKPVLQQEVIPTQGLPQAIAGAPPAEPAPANPLSGTATTPPQELLPPASPTQTTVPATTGSTQPLAVPQPPAAEVTSLQPSASAQPTSAVGPPALKQESANEQVAIPPGLKGLVAVRARASVPWLASIASREGYSIQLYAVGLNEVDKLQEYLEFLELNGMLKDAYLCRISAAGALKAQWLVLHELFAGYSEAETFIKKLPSFMSQNHPYVRNVKGIACTN